MANLTTGVGSPVWKKEMSEAAANWDPTEVMLIKVEGSDHCITLVEADADTGTYYAVLVTPLSQDAEMLTGGPAMVTILAPWRDSHALQWEGDLHSNYVAEHLTAGRFRDGLNAGDLAALTLTVASALGRKAVLDI